jgi:hypothetical protein
MHIVTGLVMCRQGPERRSPGADPPQMRPLTLMGEVLSHSIAVLPDHEINAGCPQRCHGMTMPARPGKLCRDDTAHSPLA